MSDDISRDGHRQASAFLFWAEKSGTMKTLLFDCVTEETQILSANVTEHPVETGANISDHHRRELEEVNLTVRITNQPIYTEATASRGNRTGQVRGVKLDAPQYEPYKAPFALTPGAAFSAVGDAISSGIDALTGGGSAAVTSANVLQFADPFEAVGDTFAILKRLRDTAQEVQVFLSRTATPPAMLLTKVELKRNAQFGDGAEIAMTFKELRKVKVSLVGAPIPSEPRAKPAVKKGAKDTKDAKNPERKKSALRSLAGH